MIDYGIDASFSTGDFYNRDGPNALLLNSDNSILVTGYFTHGATEANGISIIDIEGGVIFNGQGVQLLTRSITSEVGIEELNTTDWPSGLYIYQLLHDNKPIHNGKFEVLR